MLPLAAIDVPLSCVNEVALEYHVPAKLILSILEVERGKPKQIVKNKNRTYDIGPMAINSIWLPLLNQYNIHEEDILKDPCINLKVGVWILSKKMAARNNLLVGIGDYNSHTPTLNQKYYEKVKLNFAKIMILLDNTQQP